jgi:PhnB protein
MPERDLIEQLDQAVEAMLGGSSAPAAGPEVSELARVAGWLRDLPSEDFRARLRQDLAGAIRKSEKENKTMSTATANWIRAGFTSLTPYLHVANAAAEIEFLKKVLQAEELGRYASPDGSRIMHAEMRVGDSMIEMGETPGATKPTPLHVYVADVDAAYQRALEAGAVSLHTPTDHEYGERGASVRDAEGNHWYLATASGAHYVPAGVHAVNIALHPKGAPALIDFLKRAFGVEEISHHEAGGAVVHAQLKFGDSILEMGEAHGQYPPMPCAIHYYVPDVDEVYRRAVAAGAVSISAPADQAYGERSAGVTDPAGNVWYLATHLAETR